MYAISCEDESEGNMGEECKHFKELFLVGAGPFRGKTALTTPRPVLVAVVQREENADLFAQ